MLRLHYYNLGGTLPLFKVIEEVNEEIERLENSGLTVLDVDLSSATYTNTLYEGGVVFKITKNEVVEIPVFATPLPEPPPKDCSTVLEKPTPTRRKRAQ